MASDGERRGAAPDGDDGAPRPDADPAPFGFATVPVGEKQPLVDDVFHKVAARYDLMNDAMSAGLHRAWKNGLVSMLRPPKGAAPHHHLDVAGGTGDVAGRVLAVAGEGARVTVLDVNGDMLREGAARADRRLAPAARRRLAFVRANAEALPFENRRFDGYTVAFGIRNVPRRALALAEARRVLKRGGRFLCLEFAPVSAPGLKAIYDAYSFNVIPRLGALLAGDAEPYRYLVESIRTFPAPDAFAAEIEDAGFSRVTHRPLTGGVAVIHSGWVL